MDAPLRVIQGSMHPSAKAVTVIVRLKLRAGSNAAFEAIAARLIAAVRAHEPGCRSFDIQRPMGAENAYVVVGRFASFAALEAHWASPHLAEMTKEGEALAVAPPEVELFQDP